MYERKLIEYLPHIIRDVREYRAIMDDAEQDEMVLAWSSVDDAFNDQFVADATENGVKRWEKILNIVPKATLTLDERKFTILTRLNQQLPYTWKTFITKLDEICGIGNYKILTNFNEYELELTTYIDTYSRVDELENLLDYIMPANIIVNANNKINYTLTGTMFIPIGMCFCNIYELTDSYKKDFSCNLFAKLGGVYCGVCEIEMTDSFKKSVDIEINSYTGGIVSINNIIQTKERS